MRPIIIPTSIRLPLDLKKRLKAIADERRQPVSLMIVSIVEDWEKEWAKKKDWEKRERELGRLNR